RQREINPGGNPCGGVEGSVLEEECVRVNLQLREALGQFAREAPVCCHAPPVEESRRCEREDARAHGRDAADASRAALYPRRRLRIYFGVETRAPSSGDDQRVQRLHVVKGLVRLERDSRL